MMMMSPPDTTTLDGYLAAAEADFDRYFDPGIETVVAGTCPIEMCAPMVVFRIDNLSPAELQDHALVTFALDFYWAGRGGYLVAHQIWSWVYRRFLFHTDPEMEVSDYDPETGTLCFTLRWARMFKNDYEFHPLEVDGFVIRNVHIHVEAC